MTPRPERSEIHGSLRSQLPARPNTERAVTNSLMGLGGLCHIPAGGFS